MYSQVSKTQPQNSSIISKRRAPHSSSTVDWMYTTRRRIRQNKAASWSLGNVSRYGSESFQLQHQLMRCLWCGLRSVKRGDSPSLSGSVKRDLGERRVSVSGSLLTLSTVVVVATRPGDKGSGAATRARHLQVRRRQTRGGTSGSRGLGTHGRATKGR